MARARLIKRGSRAKLSGSLESALACSRACTHGRTGEAAWRTRSEAAAADVVATRRRRRRRRRRPRPRRRSRSILEPAMTTRFSNVTCRQHYPVLTSRYC